MASAPNSKAVAEGGTNGTGLSRFFDRLTNIVTALNVKEDEVAFNIRR